MVSSTVESPLLYPLISVIAFIQNFLVANFLIAYLFEYYKRVQFEEIDKGIDGVELIDVMHEIDDNDKKHSFNPSKRNIEKVTEKCLKEKHRERINSIQIDDDNFIEGGSEEQRIEFLGNLNKEWRKFKVFIISLRWATKINRSLIVICGAIAHCFEDKSYVVVFPFITTLSSFILLLIIFWLLCQTNAVYPSKRIVELIL